MSPCGNTAYYHLIHSGVAGLITGAASRVLLPTRKVVARIAAWRIFLVHDGRAARLEHRGNRRQVTGSQREG
jgi:hypothetical protein